jgi:peptidoglycan hydrolase-like protein with peptidoglycan-binding domain
MGLVTSRRGRRLPIFAVRDGASLAFAFAVVIHYGTAPQTKMVAVRVKETNKPINSVNQSQLRLNRYNFYNNGS